MIGGEHLVTLGEFRAVAKKYPDVHIIHFDAHCDLRDDYLGVKLSHACVLRRCHDIVGDVILNTSRFVPKNTSSCLDNKAQRASNFS